MCLDDTLQNDCHEKTLIHPLAKMHHPQSNIISFHQHSSTKPSEFTPIMRIYGGFETYIPPLALTHMLGVYFHQLPTIPLEYTLPPLQFELIHCEQFHCLREFHFDFRPSALALATSRTSCVMLLHFKIIKMK